MNVLGAVHIDIMNIVESWKESSYFNSSSEKTRLLQQQQQQQMRAEEIVDRSILVMASVFTRSQDSGLLHVGLPPVGAAAAAAAADSQLIATRSGSVASP